MWHFFCFRFGNDAITKVLPGLHLDVSTTQGPELQLDVSLQRSELHLDVSTYTTKACAAPGCVYSALQRTALHLEMCTLQRSVLHLDVYTTGSWAAPGLSNYRGLCCAWTCLDNMIMCCFWTCLHHRALTCTCLCCTWTCLHRRGQRWTRTNLDQRSLCFSCRCLDYRGLSCTWTYLHYRCTWTRLHHRSLSWTWTVYTREACAASICFYTTGAWAAPRHVCPVPGLVYTTESFAASARDCKIGPELLLRCLHYKCLHWFWSILHRGLICTWTFLDNRSLSFTWTWFVSLQYQTNAIIKAFLCFRFDMDDRTIQYFDAFEKY